MNADEIRAIHEYVERYYRDVLGPPPDHIINQLAARYRTQDWPG
ncbi:hypothetical protein ABIC28_002994 [Rhodococcus sp. PvR044]